MRSRRGSRLLSLISVIAIAGVLVGVSALIVIMGVMNGLQHDLREKILVGSADIQVLPNAMQPGWTCNRLGRLVGAWLGDGYVHASPRSQMPVNLRTIGITISIGRFSATMMFAAASVPLWMRTGGPFEEDQR